MADFKAWSHSVRKANKLLLWLFASTAHAHDLSSVSVSEVELKLPNIFGITLLLVFTNKIVMIHLFLLELRSFERINC